MTESAKAGRTIHVHRNQFHLSWDNSIPPIATIQSGEVVEFDLLDAAGGQIIPESTIEAIHTLDFARVDQVNGPIYVEGAKPGNTLQVDLLDLQPANWGWTAIIPAEGWAEFAPGIRIPLAPFCGEIGLAPAASGALSTIPPYRHGGNMDTKHLTKGARLFLPVEVPGALYSMGDGHAAQGDGEVCGTAIETPMRATVRLTVRDDIHVPEPQFLTSGPLAPRTNIGPYYATDGIGPDMVEATRKAVRHMIEHLQHTYGLSRTDAYMLCSVVVDLKLCEVVDMPNWLVSAFLPQSIFTS
jgi:acetamidase/formamidase